MNVLIANPLAARIVAAAKISTLQRALNSVHLKVFAELRKRVVPVVGRVLNRVQKVARIGAAASPPVSSAGTSQSRAHVALFNIHKSGVISASTAPRKKPVPRKQVEKVLPSKVDILPPAHVHKPVSLVSTNGGASTPPSPNLEQLCQCRTPTHAALYRSRVALSRNEQEDHSVH